MKTNLAWEYFDRLPNQYGSCVHDFEVCEWTMDVLKVLETMTASERAELLSYVREFFCLDCGEKMHGRVCHCENDE